MQPLRSESRSSASVVHTPTIATQRRALRPVGACLRGLTCGWLLAATLATTTALALEPLIELGALDGQNGIILRGPVPGERAIVNVTHLGDLNGDGIGDLAVAALHHFDDHRYDDGRVRVLYGSRAPGRAVVDLTSLTPTDGFLVRGGEELILFGAELGRSGDVNGDGFDDLFLTAVPSRPYSFDELYARAYLIPGRAGGFPAVSTVGDLAAGSGTSFMGRPYVRASYRMQRTSGDVNADGIPDLLLATEYTQPGGVIETGEAWVVFGREDGFSPEVSIAALDGSDGFRIATTQAQEYDELGRHVDIAGDVNGDGIDDILLGAPGADPLGRRDAGTVYVVFGRAGAWPASLDLATLDGSNGFRIHGERSQRRLGTDIAAAGDVNGDGLADILLGGGPVHVVFGRSGAAPSSVDLAAPGPAAVTALHLDGASLSVANAGDLDADGVDDLALGHRSARIGGRYRAGRVYVVYGRRAGFPATVSLSDIGPATGAVLNGVYPYSEAGAVLSGDGDVNGDGIDDLLIGTATSFTDPFPYPDEAYVVFGQRRLAHLEGTARGIWTLFALCRNLESGAITIDFSRGAWTCGAPGELGRPGEPVKVVLVGLSLPDEEGVRGTHQGLLPQTLGCAQLRTEGVLAEAPADGSWGCRDGGFGIDPFRWLVVELTGLLR